MKTAVIIPAHNESESIGKVVQDVLTHVDNVIVVDDGSQDTTGIVAREAGADVVRNDPNKGYDGALQRGFERAAEMDMGLVVTMDADGQHPADKLPLFLEPVRQGQLDMVMGIRPKTARLAEAIFGLYTRVRFGVPDILCGMKSYRMDLFHEHGCFDNVKSIGTQLPLWVLRKGYRVQKLNIPIGERDNGTTRFGGGIKANMRIARALMRALKASA